MNSRKLPASARMNCRLLGSLISKYQKFININYNYDKMIKPYILNKNNIKLGRIS